MLSTGSHMLVARPARPALAVGRRTCIRTRAQAGHSAYPFCASHYHRVALMPDPYGYYLSGDLRQSGTLQGVLAFKKHDQHNVDSSSKALEVFISGDTAIGIYHLVNSQPSMRPMALDLLWKVVEKQQQAQGKQWQLLRAAIVDLANDTFIGRIFFGNPETGEVVWDCDCRPSDAFWLSLQSGAPFYVHRDVWETSTVPLDRTQAYFISCSEEPIKAGTSTMSSDDITSLFDDDDWELPLVVQLLRREMEVAVSEEDYPLAARLRDHPYMRLSVDMEASRMRGQLLRAQELYQELRIRVSRDESQAGTVDDDALRQRLQRDINL